MWAGEDVPALLPTATSAAALELRREPQEMLLTRQMQTEEVSLQPCRAHGAWANAGDGHPRVPTTPWLEWTGLAALGQSNLYTFSSQGCGLSRSCVKWSQWNSRSCQHQLGILPRRRQWRQGVNHQ